MAAFVWALEQLLEGKKVRRSLWNPGVFWHLVGDDVQWEDPGRPGGAIHFVFNPAFREATDWELYDDRQPLTCTADAITAAFAGHKVRRREWWLPDRYMGVFDTDTATPYLGSFFMGAHSGHQPVTRDLWKAKDWEYFDGNE